MKHLILKLQNMADFPAALMSWRNVPRTVGDLSPAELFFGRVQRTLLPRFDPTELPAHWPPGPGTTSLSILSPGDLVLVQDAHSRLWDKEGVVISRRDSDRSYIISINGVHYLRNRVFLKHLRKTILNPEIAAFAPAQVTPAPLRRSARLQVPGPKVAAASALPSSSSPVSSQLSLSRGNDSVFASSLNQALVQHGRDKIKRECEDHHRAPGGRVDNYGRLPHLGGAPVLGGHRGIGSVQSAGDRAGVLLRLPASVPPSDALDVRGKRIRLGMGESEVGTAGGRPVLPTAQAVRRLASADGSSLYSMGGERLQAANQRHGGPAGVPPTGANNGGLSGAAADAPVRCGGTRRRLTGKLEDMGCPSRPVAPTAPQMQVALRPDSQMVHAYTQCVV